MASIRQNRLLPIKFNYIRSEETSREGSRIQDRMRNTLHESLGKNNKKNPFPNPYLKKFNLRKINRTQESIKRKNLKQENSAESKDMEQIEKLNQSLQLKKDKKFASIRIHTEKIRNRTTEVLKQSPYLMRSSNDPLHRMQTIDHEWLKTQSKYPFLSPFEREEIHRCDVYYIGKRRIHSEKEFTDKNNDAKISVGEAIAYRYEVLDILGKGSFGQVFKAFDHKKKELCAIKIIRKQQKFCTQARVQIKILEHALKKDPKKCNIVEMKQGFFFRGHPCIIFQLLDQNLYQFLREFKFAGISLDLILRFSIQILQGLLFLHKYRIIHCDLKPENILLKQKNKTGIKIIDLGSGCYEDEQIYTYIQSRFYRAPEIVFGIPYTCAIDIWSFGCILVELYQGYPIFPGEDQYDQIAMIMEVLGVPSEELIEKGCRTKKFFTDFKPKLRPNKKGNIRKPGALSIEQVLKCENLDFVDFIKKLLIWEPEKRMKPAEALVHPWILKGLPDEIRKQHIAQTHKQTEF